jgi:putative ABC transport system substrate-binding protein
MLSVGSSTADMAGPQPRNPTTSSLLIGLRELGYVYGEHFVTEGRSPEGQVERFPSLVAELVRLQVDVIVAAGPALAALKQGTSTIPVVMAGAEDPVGLGVVKSLARPGTNFTGLSNQAVELTVKRLELLKEIVPGGAPVAVLWDPGSLLSWKASNTAAQQRGWKLLSFEVRDIGEIEAAIGQPLRRGPAHFCRSADSYFGTHDASVSWLPGADSPRSIQAACKSATRG